MQRVFATLDLVAPMNSTVLIQGETGTGKDLIARTIHHNSARRDRQFVAFNAAAIPEGLAEAELFGQCKGAFTGAVSARVGRFALADKGTLFIDEVATMSMPLQAKLLRALQEREVERVGETTPHRSRHPRHRRDERRPATRVKEGTFREDLFYRLNVVPSASAAAARRAARTSRCSRNISSGSPAGTTAHAEHVDQAAMRVLMAYAWPGNIRQLENAIEHAVAMSGTGTRDHGRHAAGGPARIQRAARARTVAIPDEGLNFISIVSQLERDLILRILEKTGGNKRQAARLLQLSRTTLIDKLQRLGAAGHPPATTHTAETA